MVTNTPTNSWMRAWLVSLTVMFAGNLWCSSVLAVDARITDVKGQTTEVKLLKYGCADFREESLVVKRGATRVVFEFDKISRLRVLEGTRSDPRKYQESARPSIRVRLELTDGSSVEGSFEEMSSSCLEFFTGQVPWGSLYVNDWEVDEIEFRHRR